MLPPASGACFRPPPRARGAGAEQRRIGRHAGAAAVAAAGSDAGGQAGPAEDTHPQPEHLVSA